MYEGIYKSITVEDQVKLNPVMPFPVDKTRDQYCGRGKFCEIGTAIQNPLYTASMYAKVQEINMTLFYNTTEYPNFYKMTETQRFFVNVKPFSFRPESNLGIEFAARPCNLTTICARNDYYFDQSMVVSPPGVYRPFEDCNEPVPNDDFDYYFWGAKGMDRFELTRRSTQMGKYLIKSNIHRKACYINAGCLGVPKTDWDTKCCIKGWCTCPP